MRIFLSILWGWSLASFATAQILPESGQSFHAEKFISYTEHADTLNGILYQVGTYNPADSPDIHLPIYLRIARQGSEKYYDLDTKYDPDMFRFPDLSSDRLVIIKGRYAFYVYDIHQQTLSRKLHPGLGQYEGEDAISGLYAGLTFFDHEKFILGNVQGFGVFCYDISDPADPVELMQYAIKKPDEELPFYVFLHKTDSNLFDMLCAQADTASKSLISRHYNRLKTVRYGAQGIALDIDISKFPIPQPTPDEHYLSQEYFSQISAVKEHTYTGKTDDFCSSEHYEYANGIRYAFTDYGPCEQCGRGVTKIFIPNFNITQGFMFTLVFYGYRSPKDLHLERATDNEIRLLWEYSEIKIIAQEDGILIMDDVML